MPTIGFPNMATRFPSSEDLGALSPTTTASDEAEEYFQPHPPQLTPVITNNNMKLYTKADILKISQFIRDEVMPHLRNEGSGMQTASLMALLTDQLNILRDALVDKDLLVNTRIERALYDVVKMQGELPKSITDKASAVLEAWSTHLQCPIEPIIKPDLWCKDGRMEGLTRIESWKRKSEDERMTEFGPKNYEVSFGKWIIDGEFESNAEKAYQFGNRGLEPGKQAPPQHLKTGTANPVTYDDDGVYAFILSDYVEEIEEVGRPAGSMLKYSLIGPNPAKWKLLKNNLRREPVRILRHHRLGTDLAPKYGVRFDGMYDIRYIGTKLSNTTGMDVWRVTITFDRARGQPSLKSAQVHPLTDELEDWEEYQKIKEERRARELRCESLFDAYCKGTPRIENISLDTTDKDKEIDHSQI